MNRILIEQTRPSITCEDHQDEPLDNYHCLFCRIRELEELLGVHTGCRECAKFIRKYYPNVIKTNANRQ